jgi:fructose 1,6-bisphosphate aldolase/phosphatase
MWAAGRTMIMRNQGFIHLATLVPDELEYNKSYEARMAELNKKLKLNKKFKDTE